ncbi:hypothetical protein ES705_35228 [subsurface metagenome]
MTNEAAKAVATIPEEMESYAQISRLARCGQFVKALESVKQSTISQSMKQHLQRVLESNDQYVIDRTFLEIDSRIAQALCWDCWRD